MGKWLPRNKDDIAASGAEAALAVGEVIADGARMLPLGPSLRPLGKWWIDRAARRNLEIAQPYIKDLPSEPWQLAEMLPWMLAQDLHHHRSDHPRECFLLLVDEYEDLSSGGDAGGHWRTNGFDTAMRAFVSEVNGLLARRMLPWGEDADWQANLAAADCPLEGLKDHDALAWLAQVPVADAEIAAAMLEGAREEKRADALVYPLLLELQVGHWRNLTGNGVAFAPDDVRVDAEGFRDRCRMLAERLMRGFRNDHSLIATVERLCVANRFDRVAFGCVLEAFQTGLPLDFFDALPNLSFITAGEDGWLTMHRAIAEAITETLEPDRRRESVEALLTHFEERATVERGLDVTDATVEALFEAAHLRRQLGAEGFTGWLFPPSAIIAQSARYALVEQVWRDALVFCETSLGLEHEDTAACYNNVAANLNAQGRYAEAEPLARKGLDIRERVLGTDHPDTAASYNNVATNLLYQGRLVEAEPYPAQSGGSDGAAVGTEASKRADFAGEPGCAAGTVGEE